MISLFPLPSKLTLCHTSNPPNSPVELVPLWRNWGTVMLSYLLKAMQLVRAKGKIWTHLINPLVRAHQTLESHGLKCTEWLLSDTWQQWAQHDSRPALWIHYFPIRRSLFVAYTNIYYWIGHRYVKSNYLPVHFLHYLVNNLKTRMCFISVCIPRTWHIVGAQYLSTELNCAIQARTLYFTSQAIQDIFSLQRPVPLWTVPLMCQRSSPPLPWHQHGTSSSPSPSHTLHLFFLWVKH